MLTPRLWDVGAWVGHTCQTCVQREWEDPKVPRLKTRYCRIETLLKKLQSRIPVVSEAEQEMHRELKNMADSLQHYTNSIQQVRLPAFALVHLPRRL